MTTQERPSAEDYCTAAFVVLVLVVVLIFGTAAAGAG